MPGYYEIYEVLQRPCPISSGSAATLIAIGESLPGVVDVHLLREVGVTCNPSVFPNVPVTTTPQGTQTFSVTSAFTLDGSGAPPSVDLVAMIPGTMTKLAEYRDVQLNIN